ncbi:MAG TPA: DUF2585 domain-containing protein [Vicinamibacterales bacterium]|nr:DUF2585 domain-containing protein [Vicinamibacterales bacterium]
MTRRSTWAIVATAVAIVVAVAMAEQAMGRVIVCRCGYVKLWHGVVSSAENSQHLTDWYTPSHVIHGMAFYGLLWLVARRTPVGVRLLAAMFIEGSWEVFENTPFVIDRYRTATIALDYYGDSLVNSVSDIVAMMSGFWIARRLPLWASVVLVAALEVFVLVMIRDNLTLNIVMLLYPLEAIRQWQSGT